MSRPITRRAPTRNGGFSWGRFPMGDTGIVAYRLFRRDQSGTVHFQGFTAQPYHTRAEIAVGLRAACHRLRDRVDEIDLVELGVAA
ncbi:hypothetical protein ACTUVK_000500 [Stenotrophomonas rhizophila]